MEKSRPNGQPANGSSYKTLRSKFFASGVIVLASIFTTLMLVLPFISLELDEQINHLEKDLNENIRQEAITLSRLLVFEFSRLEDLIDILYIQPDDLAFEDAKIPIKNYLWEKVTFNAVIRDIHLLDSSGQILLVPFGQDEQQVKEENRDNPLAIQNFLHITKSVNRSDEQNVYVFMPLYITGNRWGVVKISVSTIEVENQLRNQIAKQDSFRQLIIILFIAAIVLASLLGVFVLNYLAQKVTDPIKLLARNAEIFAVSGDSSKLENIEAENDEVGLLAQNFNTMADEINRLLREKDDAFSQLKESQEQLRQSEKLATLGQLSGGIAHEINNALSPIRLRAEEILLTMEEGGNAESDDLNVILKGIEQCTSIVQKLRDFSSPTLGTRSLVDLNSIISETLALIRRQIENKRIKIEMNLAPLPKIMANPGELEQVIMNMVLNSRDAVAAKAESTGNVIRISTSVVENSISLVIADNGIGMNEETRQRMFDPFFTTKEVGKGTGLGMSVSFGILQNHRATIAVESAPGEGTVLTVNFPIQNKAE